jgi:AraC-like DNA-binding protein
VFFVKLSDIRKFQQSFPSPEAVSTLQHHQQLLKELGLEPGSFYQELEMDSPFVDTHQDITSSNSQLQFHSHTFYEMLCCRNTCGAEYLVGSERYKLQKGDIIFVPPGISHRPLLAENQSEPYIRDVIWISEEFMQMMNLTTPDFITADFKQPFLFRTAGTEWTHICDLFRQGVREADNSFFGWNTLIAANTINILVQLIRAGKDLHTKPMEAEKPDLLDQILAYIEVHISDKITLAATAHHFFISESTISQTFRKKMGISFYQCVTQTRLIASKALIEKNIALETVAEQVGFNDYSSFYRAFKQEYGISPRQYRKMQSP